MVDSHSNSCKRLPSISMCRILAARSGWRPEATSSKGRRGMLIAKDGWMGRSFLCALFLCCTFVLIRPVAACETKTGSEKRAQVLLAQETPTVTPPSTQTPEPASNPPVTNAKTETEQYTLSHERYEKAVAYSRASYTLYFIWVSLGMVVVWLFLPLGKIAHARFCRAAYRKSFS